MRKERYAKGRRRWARKDLVRYFSFLPVAFPPHLVILSTPRLSFRMTSRSTFYPRSPSDTLISNISSFILYTYLITHSQAIRCKLTNLPETEKTSQILPNAPIPPHQPSRTPPESPTPRLSLQRVLFPWRRFGCGRRGEVGEEGTVGRNAVCAIWIWGIFRWRGRRSSERQCPEERKREGTGERVGGGVGGEGFGGSEAFLEE